MRTRFLLLAVNLVILSQPGHATDDDAWTADANGCKVWNHHPKPDETVTWSGTCKDGYADGPGILQWQHGGNPGSRLEATLVRGKASGKGSLILAGGVRFEGNFVDGLSSGKGVVTWPNGDRYEGDIEDGKLTGKGVFVTAAGARYEGDWVDNAREGRGTAVSVNGDRYEGQWHGNKPSGSGVMRWADGSHYEGEFVDGNPSNPNLIVRKTYSIKNEGTGSHIARDAVWGVDVPIDKGYAELTAAEQQRVKSRYEAMPEGDEPPYPIGGLRAILEACATINQKLRVQGTLGLAVTVDKTGHAVSVDLLESPDKQMTKLMAEVLMLQKYKPAVCGGVPCVMQFPFRMTFRHTL